MVGYRWTCQACEAGNEPNLDKCEFCGCPANAGSEDIEKHTSPEGFKKRKAKEQYSNSLFIYFFIPFFAAIHAVNGRYETLLLLLGITAAFSYKNIKLITHIWNDDWARTSLITISSLFLASILIRIFLIPDNSDLVWWSALFHFLLIPFSSYYFFKSKNGKRVFSEYYSKANKVVNADK
ncbi:hypothetical protein [Shewanella sp. cp20]|uniref:hypothetical protein n=1 Tax=Shewanella sp. cp20 TaxID=1521167 RepID=UPI00059F7473|nr:hypothetical protein [Shewanella sp. cp20]KIO38091.1 hypothetical protein DB48_00645 [Shewanella sp. cp20]